MAEAGPAGPAEGAGGQARARSEHRWPMAVAVIAVIVFLALLPNGIWPGPRWVLSLAGVLLAAPIVTAPAVSTAGRGYSGCFRSPWLSC